MAVLGSAFNTGYRNSIDGHLAGLPAEVANRRARRRRSRCSSRTRIPGGDALADAAREAFTTGMRYAVLVGMALLLVGAVFVWFRGPSRTDEMLEDELDRGARRRLTRRFGAAERPMSRVSGAETGWVVRT